MVEVKVNEAAKLAGVSVRTLHYYDKIGLLKPNAVGENGYRLYSEDDFIRLQQILFFKELDFSLEEIKNILDNPHFDRKSALITHRQLLVEKQQRLKKIIGSVDKTIQSIEGGTMMSKQEMFEPFDRQKIKEHQKRYEQEVKEKYGDSDAYKQSNRKTAGYKEKDWQQIQGEMIDIYRRIAAVMSKGAGDEEVQQAVGEWRQHITSHYYDCTPEIFRGLGDMYVSDPRFTSFIDKEQEGLVAFLREAMHEYCDRLEREPS
ncbi:MAG: MerR family transcriptional regulator [Candidatus Pristimantibacillus sp.]